MGVGGGRKKKVKVYTLWNRAGLNEIQIRHRTDCKRTAKRGGSRRQSMSIMGKMGEWQVCAVCCNTKRLLREKKKNKCPKCRPGWRRKWWRVRVKQSRRVLLLFFFIRQVVAQRRRIHVSVLGGGLCVFFLYFCAEVAPQAPRVII